MGLKNKFKFKMTQKTVDENYATLDQTLVIFSARQINEKLYQVCWSDSEFHTVIYLIDEVKYALTNKYWEIVEKVE